MKMSIVISSLQQKIRSFFQFVYVKAYFLISRIFGKIRIDIAINIIVIKNTKKLTSEIVRIGWRTERPYGVVEIPVKFLTL